MTADRPASDGHIESYGRWHYAAAFWRRFIRSKVAAVSLGVVLLVVLAGIIPWLLQLSIGERNLSVRLEPPFSTEGGFHLFGTDALGRDILARLIEGSRVSLLVGFTAVVVAGTVGVTLGITAGYFGGWVDSVIMRWTDVQLSIPFLIMALAIVAVLGSGLWNVIIVLAITGWVQYARVVRAEVLKVREAEFVTAAQSIGTRTVTILRRHILPNVISSIIVLSSLQVARFILMEASLSFLGLGVPIAIPTWGRMVADGRDYLSVSPWVSAMPGLAIFVTVISINVVGDRLRDMLNPQFRDEA